MIFPQNTLIYADIKISKILQEIDEIGEMNILIEGESGVGKTPVARYANMLLGKNKNDRPFVRINCAGLNRERMQDELFGHKRGAFTGADNDRVGHVELSKGGDLFLDEIAELDLHCQAELLTFLDSGEFRRLGDSILRYSDCRIISATNRNIKNMVEQGEFRKDLYSRIAQIRIFVPPLRERKADIKPIMDYYIEKSCGYLKPYAKRVFDLFMKLDWEEGNIRQLRDAVVYMCRKSSGKDMMDLCDLSMELFDQNFEIKNSVVVSSSSVMHDVFSVGYPDYMERVEKNVLLELVKEKESVRSLARKVKIPHTTLQRKLKKYGLA